jgi:hypothetical protein
MENITATFTALMMLPVIIDAPGQYITRGGETVTIYMATDKNSFACSGFYSNEIGDSWHKSGRLYFHEQSANDIVKKV